MSLRHVVRLTVAALVVAAAGVVVPSPALAATCATSAGVTVVVDFHQLGGGAQSFCDPYDSAKNAADELVDAGYSLTYVAGEPFVCQVNAKPASQCQQTPPADAYWSLWWSNGRSDQWTYSSVGVKSLKVPDGGYVGLSWQGQTSQAKPRVPATAHSTPSASPSPHPTRHATPHPSTSPHPVVSPSHAAGSASAAPPAAPTSAPSGPTSAETFRTHASRRATRAGTPSASPRSKATASRTRVAAAAGPVAPARASAPASGSAGLPGWVAPVAVLVLFAGAGALFLARRGSSGGA